MIVDRTKLDVNNAIDIIESKIKKFIELTNSDIATLERGALTFNTINRIEDKQYYLRSKLNSLGYWNTDIINQTWTDEDYYDKDNFDRLVNNLNVLKDAFFVYKYTPKTPQAKYHYENINQIEKILVDIENIINDMQELYRRCGTFECGEV